MVEATTEQATVTLPSALADVAHKIAAEQHWTLDKALLFLIKRGVKAQEEADRALDDAYERYVQAGPEEKKQTGDDLIRAIFGPESLA